MARAQKSGGLPGGRESGTPDQGALCHSCPLTPWPCAPACPQAYGEKNRLCLAGAWPPIQHWGAARSTGSASEELPWKWPWTVVSSWSVHREVGFPGEHTSSQGVGHMG